MYAVCLKLYNVVIDYFKFNIYLLIIKLGSFSTAAFKEKVQNSF
jgi:hypothetical protein